MIKQTKKSMAMIAATTALFAVVATLFTNASPAGGSGVAGLQNIATQYQSSSNGNNQSARGLANYIQSQPNPSSTINDLKSSMNNLASDLNNSGLSVATASNGLVLNVNGGNNPIGNLIANLTAKTGAPVNISAGYLVPTAALSNNGLLGEMVNTSNGPVIQLSLSSVSSLINGQGQFYVAQNVVHEFTHAAFNDSIASSISYKDIPSSLLGSINPDVANTMFNPTNYSAVNANEAFSYLAGASLSFQNGQLGVDQSGSLLAANANAIIGAYAINNVLSASVEDVTVNTGSDGVSVYVSLQNSPNSSIYVGTTSDFGIAEASIPSAAPLASQSQDVQINIIGSLQTGLADMQAVHQQTVTMASSLPSDQLAKFNQQNSAMSAGASQNGALTASVPEDSAATAAADVQSIGDLASSYQPSANVNSLSTPDLSTISQTTVDLSSLSDGLVQSANGAGLDLNSITSLASSNLDMSDLAASIISPDVSNNATDCGFCGVINGPADFSTVRAFVPHGFVKVGPQ